MTKRMAPSRPGNDGEWFLELVAGAADTRSSPHPAVPPRVAEPPTGGAEGTGVTGNAGEAPKVQLRNEASNTTKTVERMWKDDAVNPMTKGVQTTAAEPFADWIPEELSKTVGSRRNYRWSVLAAVVITGGLLGLVLVWVPTISERAASERAVAYAESLVDLRRRLPDAQGILGAVTDLTQDIPGDAAATVTGLTSAAKNTSDLAAEDLPATFPLVPRSPIEELQPHREQLGLIASDATAIGSRLDAIYAYREMAANLVALPSLPTQADAAAINELSVDLATLVADANGGLAGLPVDNAMAAHRSRVGEVVDRLGEWQVEYLDALRREDTETAAALVDETTLWEQRLDTAMRAGLGAARTELDTELVRLAGDIERVLAGLPG